MSDSCSKNRYEKRGGYIGKPVSTRSSKSGRHQLELAGVRPGTQKDVVHPLLVPRRSRERCSGEVIHCKPLTRTQWSSVEVDTMVQINLGALNNLARRCGRAFWTQT